MKDLRDPALLGGKLLAQKERLKLSKLSYATDELYVPDYRDETTLEKYGDPRLLPSTLPN